MNVVLLSERPERHAIGAKKEPPRPKGDRHKPADRAVGEKACAHVAHSTSTLSTLEKDIGKRTFFFVVTPPPDDAKCGGKRHVCNRKTKSTL
jgi:hypothetical protein